MSNTIKKRTVKGEINRDTLLGLGILCFVLLLVMCGGFCADIYESTGSQLGGSEIPATVRRVLVDIVDVEIPKGFKPLRHKTKTSPFKGVHYSSVRYEYANKVRYLYADGLWRYIASSITFTDRSEQDYREYTLQPPMGGIHKITTNELIKRTIRGAEVTFQLVCSIEKNQGPERVMVIGGFPGRLGGGRGTTELFITASTTHLDEQAARRIISSIE